MAVVSEEKRIKKLRQQMYFDLSAGVISASISLGSIIYVYLNRHNFSMNLGFFILGLTFWIAYLCFSIFLICLGIYIAYQDKHWDPSMQRKNLKAPRIG